MLKLTIAIHHVMADIPMDVRIDETGSNPGVAQLEHLDACRSFRTPRTKASVFDDQIPAFGEAIRQHEVPGMDGIWVHDSSLSARNPRIRLYLSTRITVQSVFFSTDEAYSRHARHAPVPKNPLTYQLHALWPFSAE